ncbi:leukotriene B4 receptor 1-like [Lissotriton helveticus]
MGLEPNTMLGYDTTATTGYSLTATTGSNLYTTVWNDSAKATSATPSPVAVPLLYVLVPSLFLGACFLLGILGNGLVIHTILFQIGQRSFTVVLLLNMAAADFIALVTLPMWIHSLCDQWVYGLLFCKFLTYVIYLSMYASVFFITLVSVHRFLAVLFPFFLLRWQRRTIIHGVILATWAMALAFASPVFVFRSTVERNGTVQCSGRIYSSTQQKLAILLLETLVGFVLPFCVLSVCYISILRRIQHLRSRKKIKTEKLIGSVVISFFLCWFPYHIFNLMQVSSLLMETSNPQAAAAVDKVVKAGNNIPGTFAFISSCLNPILYAFAAQSFRGGLKATNFAKLFGQITDDMLEKKSTKHCRISDGSQ